MASRYCLGYTHPKCNMCEHYLAWKALNEMPDERRKQTQMRMQSIHIDKCRLTGMSEFKELPRA